MKRLPSISWIILGSIAFTQTAYANTGTPLMWAEATHLVFGNLLIGIGEGLLLAWFFALPKVKCVSILVIANYFSAWVGALWIFEPIMAKLPLNLNNAWVWFWVMVFGAYCATLILEWAFVAGCFYGTNNWLKRSVWGSLLIQSVSYALLFGWYWIPSRTSLFTDMTIVSPAKIPLPESVVVYFIDVNDGNVYCRGLVDGDPKLVFDLHSTHLNDRLFVQPSKLDNGRWDLLARLEKGVDPQNSEIISVLSNLSVNATQDKTYRAQPEGTKFNLGDVPVLDPTLESNWSFNTGYNSRLTAVNQTTTRISFAYETPFITWRMRNAVQLPTDKVLFQLGRDQICAFDPRSRQVTLLWHGRGPVPVIPYTVND